MVNERVKTAVAEKRQLARLQGAEARIARSYAVASMALALGISERQVNRELAGRVRQARVRKPAPRGRAALVARQKKARG